MDNYLDESCQNEMYANNKLHVYCLYELFKYIPVSERPKLSVVCQRWKDVVSSFVFQDKKLELSFSAYNDYGSDLNIRYPNAMGQVAFIKSLVRKTGQYLTVLDLSACGNSMILPVINNACSSLETLRIRLENAMDEALTDVFSNLNHLKILTIIFHNMIYNIIPVNLINSLENVRNTLIKLSMVNLNMNNIFLNYYFPHETDGVIRSLLSLEYFEVVGLTVPASLLPYLQEMSIKLMNMDNNLLARHRSDLTNMSFVDVPVTDNFLYTMVNTINMIYKLQIDCQLITSDGMKSIAQMKNLKQLFCYGKSDIGDASIKLLSNLIKLKLPYSMKITKKSVLVVLKNSPAMNYLSVNKTGVEYDFIGDASRICIDRTSILLLCFERNVHSTNLDSFQCIQNNLYVYYTDEKEGSFCMENYKLPNNINILPHQRYKPMIFGSSVSAILL